MNPKLNTEYQDPRLPGSLSRALQAWQILVARRCEGNPQHIAFTFSCPSESRAHRVAGFLRRRLVCGATTVSRIEGGSRDEWHVDGKTRYQMQSLRNLEHLFTWLRGTAHRHQVQLIDLSPRWECGPTTS